MSFSSPSIDTRPSVVSTATVKNLTAEVERVADQNQMVVQDSNAFSGARSVNDMTDTAVISQAAVGTNNKEIEIQNPASGVEQPTAVSTEILATDFDSLGRATIEQNQGAIQGAFAQGTDFDGNPSSAVNNATLSEDVAQDQVSELRNQVSGIRNQKSEDTPAAALQNSNTPALQHSTLDTAAATEPGLTEPPHSHTPTPPNSSTSAPPTVNATPARDFRPLHRPLSVREEQNRLASSASLSLPSFLGYSFNLASLPIPSFTVRLDFAIPGSLLLPSTPVIAPLPSIAPDHFTMPAPRFHPDVFTLPAPVSLNVTA